MGILDVFKRNYFYVVKKKCYGNEKYYYTGKAWGSMSEAKKYSLSKAARVHASVKNTCTSGYNVIVEKA